MFGYESESSGCEKVAGIIGVVVVSICVIVLIVGIAMHW